MDIITKIKAVMTANGMSLRSLADAMPAPSRSGRDTRHKGENDGKIVATVPKMTAANLSSKLNSGTLVAQELCQICNILGAEMFIRFANGTERPLALIEQEGFKDSCIRIRDLDIILNAIGGNLVFKLQNGEIS